MEDVAVAASALEGSPLFGGLDREDVEGIVRIGQPASFEEGQPIVERGGAGDAMYVIVSGIARVDVGGRYHDLRSGDFFGEMALLAGRKRMATVSALEAVEVIRIPAEGFQAFLLEHPRVAVTMLRSVVERLREVQERIDSWIGVW